MPCEDRHAEIGGHKWSTTQMAPSEALLLEAQLAPLIAQGLVPVLATLGQSDDVQAETIASAVRSIAASLPPAEYARLITFLCEKCFKDGKAVVFDMDFQGGAGVMLRYRVAWFVLEANFADFFGELLPAGVVDRARAKFQASTGPE